MNKSIVKCVAVIIGLQPFWGCNRSPGLDNNDGKGSATDCETVNGSTRMLLPYGIVTDATRGESNISSELIQCAAEGGMGYMRVNLDWSKCQSVEGGAWDFAWFDRFVDEAESKGVVILPIMSGPPKWAYPAWQHPDAFADFCRATVIRYGKRIPVLEIWNEQNIPGFWKDPNPSNYVFLLRKAYNAVKSANPSIRVASGGTAGWAPEFFEGCYESGMKECCDVVCVHPYSTPYAPEGTMTKDLPILRKLMAKYGDADKPIWFTEIGWSTQLLSVSGVGNFMEAGLNVAIGHGKPWNVVYAAAIPDDMPEDRALTNALLEQMPTGSKVKVCGPKETVRLLQEGGWDAVIYPPDETTPGDTVEAVYEFVKRGGTLVELGGVPFWGDYRNLPDGGSRRKAAFVDGNILKRLHLSCDAPWMKGSELPKGNLRVYATDEGLAAGVRQEPIGFACGTFLDSRNLKDGDRMIPLVKGINPKNGKDVVAACVYLLNSDLKGRVVVSCVSGSRMAPFAVNEGLQAVNMVRALGIAMAEGIEGFFIYCLRAPERDRYYSEENYGIVHADLTSKPAWDAMRNFSIQRPYNSVRLGNKWHKDGFYYPQWKRPDGVAAGMVWKIGQPQRMRLKFDGERVRFVDVVGKLANVRSMGGNVYSLEVGESPIYFSNASLTGAEVESRGEAK